MRMMTEAMPITMPSIARMERILRCTRLRVAVLKASLKSMVRFLLFERAVGGMAPRGDRRIALHHAVPYPDNSIRKFRRLRLVRHQNNRAAFFIEPLKYFHDLQSGL